MSSTEKSARRKFTPEVKAHAVKRVLAGPAVAAVARELGSAESLLHTWVTRHRLQESQGARHPEQAAEMARLKRALAQKEEAGAVLKKAAAYLAHHQNRRPLAGVPAGLAEPLPPAPLRAEDHFPPGPEYRDRRDQPDDDADGVEKVFRELLE
jgi:transposase-like protein